MSAFRTERTPSAFLSDRPPSLLGGPGSSERQTSDPGTGEATAQRSVLLRDCMSDEEKDGGLSDTRYHTIHFFCGNPTVELTFGVMELFRRWQRVGDRVVGNGAGRSPARPPSKLLCILSVPVHMSAADFCQFTGSFGKDIIRMLML